MVAQKVAFRVVAPDCMPKTAGTLGVSAVFTSEGLHRKGGS